MVVEHKKLQKSFANSHYEEDFHFAIQLNRRLLTPIGMWPVNSKSSKEQFLANLLRISCIMIIVFLFVPGCIDIFLTRNFEVGLIKAGPLSFTIMNMLYYCFFLFHRKEICVCFETMCNDWRSVSIDNRKIMLNSANKARKIILLCAIFMFSGSLSFTVFFPLLDNYYFAKENLTARNTAFPANFLFFDTNVRPYYDIIFCLQIFGSFSCCSLTCGICSITISFVMHISGQLEIVNGFLQLLVQETSDAVRVSEKMISLIVKQHLKSLR